MRAPHVKSCVETLGHWWFIGTSLIGFSAQTQRTLPFLEGNRSRLSYKKCLPMYILLMFLTVILLTEICSIVPSFSVASIFHLYLFVRCLQNLMLKYQCNSSQPTYFTPVFGFIVQFGSRTTRRNIIIILAHNYGRLWTIIFVSLGELHSRAWKARGVVTGFDSRIAKPFKRVSLIWEQQCSLNFLQICNIYLCLYSVFGGVALDWFADSLPLTRVGLCQVFLLNLFNLN